MSTIIEASPLEKLSREPLPTGDSCVLVIFGASGDLTKRKLIPGLYNLSCAGCMNPQFEVLGIGRTPMSTEELRKKSGEAAAKSKDTRDFSESGWTDFETRLHYMVGDINDPSFYPQLRIRLEEMEKNGSSPNHELSLQEFRFGWPRAASRSRWAECSGHPAPSQRTLEEPRS
jgi:glucose-6-phosphate 1-dehydrogenase